jgi:hypothetical protein
MNFKRRLKVNLGNDSTCSLEDLPVQGADQILADREPQDRESALNANLLAYADEVIK